MTLSTYMALAIVISLVIIKLYSLFLPVTTSDFTLLKASKLTSFVKYIVKASLQTQENTNLTGFYLQQAFLDQCSAKRIFDFAETLSFCLEF